MANTNDIRVLIRDINGDEIAELIDYENLDVKAEFNASGSFSITTFLSNEKSDLLLTRGNGIVLRRKGSTSSIFSGPVWRINKNWTRGAQASKLVISGPMDTGLLASRIVLPEPGTLVPPYSTDSHHVVSGPSETVLYTYVDYHAGTNAKFGRAIPGLTLSPDQARGSGITGRGRYQNLLTFLQEKAREGGDLGFEVLDSTFLVYFPEDKTDQIVFSEGLQNIQSYDFILRYPKGNYIDVAGQGEGTSRDIIEVQNSESINEFGRFEIFKDQRDESSLAQLVASGQGELLANATEYSVTIEPTEDSGIKYQEDYKLGDTINVRIDGFDISQVVREVKIKGNQSTGITIKPTLGPPSYSQNKLINKLIFRESNLDAKLRGLENI